MSGWQTLMSAWDWKPSVVAGCAVLLLAYFGVQRFKVSKVAFFFVAGVIVLLLALVSPLDALGDNYLFSAHMLQHILLILVVPPLLLLGIPRNLALRFLRLPLASRTECVLSRPLLAWTLGIGAMWLWHWPLLYNAALATEQIHVVEHLIFLVTATIFWWPVIGPIRELRLAPLGAVVYVFSACVAHTVLAILLTFAPLGLYPAYLRPLDTLHIVPMIRDEWGMTPQVDQQWGGLMMWIPACVVYLAVLLAILARWYRGPEADASRPLLPILAGASGETGKDSLPNMTLNDTVGK